MDVGGEEGAKKGEGEEGQQEQTKTKTKKFSVLLKWLYVRYLQQWQLGPTTERS